MNHGTLMNYGSLSMNHPDTSQKINVSQRSNSPKIFLNVVNTFLIS